VNDCLGYLYELVAKYRKQTGLDKFEFEEVLSVAYIEAEQLLREKYDPEKATVTTFLSSFLYGRVSYRLLRSTGMRKRLDGWKKPSQITPPQSIPYAEHPLEAVQLEDLINSLPEKLQETARRVAQGDDLGHVVTGYDEASFESVNDGWILEVLVDEVREEFVQALKPRTQ